MRLEAMARGKTFYGPHAEEFAVVARQLAAITLALAERLEPRLDSSEPFAFPRAFDDDARWAYGQLHAVLEKTLHEIAPDAFMRDPVYGVPELNSEPPWVHLERALDGKISAIVGRGVLDDRELARRERPWKVLFEHGNAPHRSSHGRAR